MLFNAENILLIGSVLGAARNGERRLLVQEVDRRRGGHDVAALRAFGPSART